MAEPNERISLVQNAATMLHFELDRLTVENREVLDGIMEDSPVCGIIFSCQALSDLLEVIKD